MKKNVHQESLREFMAAFREVGKQVHQKRVLGERVPLPQVMNALIDASYQTLSGAILSRLILEGLVAPSQQGLSHVEKVLRRETIAHEILRIIATDMEELDTRHEYSVGFAKRERRGGPKK